MLCGFAVLRFRFERRVAGVGGVDALMVGASGGAAVVAGGEGGAVAVGMSGGGVEGWSMC